jgi:hypothetical protein
MNNLIFPLPPIQKGAERGGVDLGGGDCVLGGQHVSVFMKNTLHHEISVECVGPYLGLVEGIHAEQYRLLITSHTCQIVIKFGNSF